MFGTWIADIFIFSLIVAPLAVYVILKRHYKYWAKKGVPYLEPHLIFGNAKDILLANISLVDYYHHLYREFKKYKFGGFFRFQRPMLMVTDPELTKHILVKDFPHFYNHSGNLLEKGNPLSFHLFNLVDDKWRQIRVKLTPTFSSGKMKLMFYLVKECSQLLNDTMRENLSRGNSEIELKELMERYGIDVISSCAFGLQANSLGNAEVNFRKMAAKVFQGSFKQKIFMLLNFISPTIRKALRLTTLESDLIEFFINLVSDTIRYRQNHPQARRNDFIDLLIDLKDEEKLNKTEQKAADISMELLAAQCYLFFVAGFETSSGVLSHCLLELAKHPDVQERTHNEIVEALKKYDDNITYDTIMHSAIPYLDQVISETLRLYPSLPILIRQCTKSYRIPGTDVVIDEGTEVIIPNFGFHHDAKYFEDPEKFNPDNFTEENKSKRHPYAYLPFGEGPRMCIGTRFGLMQVKLGLITLLKQYRFELSSKMKFPVKFKPRMPITSIIGGIWLNCHQR